MSMSVPGVAFYANDAEAVVAAIPRLRNQLQASVRSRIARIFARDLVYDADAWQAGLKGTAPEPTPANIRAEIERRIEDCMKGRRDPELDFYASIILVRHAGSLYGILLCECSQWHDLITYALGAAPFGYSDAIDCGMGVEQDEWDRRGKVWNAVFSEVSTYAEAGEVYDLGTKDIPWPTPADLLDCRPTDTERLDRLLHTSLLSRRMRAEGYPEADLSMSRFVEIATDVDRSIKQGCEVVQTERARLATILASAPDRLSLFAENERLASS